MGLRRVRYPFPKRRWQRLRTAALVAIPVLALVALFAVGTDTGTDGAAADPVATSGDAAPGASTEVASEAPGGVAGETAAGDDVPAAGPGGVAGAGAPIAKIVVGPVSTPGVAVQFSSEGSAAADGGPLSYRWDFGDGSFPPVTEPAPLHTYKESGRFAVTLTVSDAGGATATATVEVTQTRPPGNIALVTRDVDLPSPGAVAPMRVWYQGQLPHKPVVAKICGVSMADPAFELGSDCSLMSEVMVNGTASGDGWIDLQVFRGPEPGGDAPWGCFAPGDPAPAGVRSATTCFVRVTSDVWSNTETQQEVSFTVG